MNVSRDGTMRVTLTVAAGPHKGQVFTFVGHDMFIVGRSKQAHFRASPKDRYFSRIHFMVEMNPPHCRLMDLNSRNGTAVNGAKVTSTDLKDGDKIQAGRTILRVSVKGDERIAALARHRVPAETATVPPVAVSRTPAPRRLARPAAALPARYDTMVPPARAGSVPPPPRQPFPQEEPCPICADLVSVEALSAPGLTGLSPICPACQEKIRNHHQPIPDYLFVEELGRGGMGVVSLALSRFYERLIAVKMITPVVATEPSEINRFIREAEILRDLRHPNIVAFLEMGHVRGTLYFAMEYVHGLDAAQLVKQCGPLPVGRAVGIICQALAALEYAHARRFVHRDIKPANLLVTKEDGNEVVKLADFGLARVYQASKLSGLTMMGDRGGTVAFMPPEQVTHFRDVKPAADQYSAAASLYTLLTAKPIYELPPFLHEQLAVILNKAPVPIEARRPDLPASLAQVIHRGLAREPAERFPDIRSMRQALEKFRE